MRALGELVLTNATQDLLDEDGRPVGEVASRRYADVATETVRCPYRDQRLGGVMNRSALRQMGVPWPSLLRTFRALAGPDPTVASAFRAAIVCTTAPGVASLQQPGRPIPRALSALYKTSLGLSQVLAALLLAEDGVADAPLGALGDGRAFFRFLDDGRWLVGQEQVCAGTEAMIVEAWDALSGDGEGELAPELAALGDWRAWSEVPRRFVGAVAVAGLAVGGDPRGLEVWLGPKGPAWTRSLFAVPGRRPAHALRLFPSGSPPAGVAELLELPPVEGRVWADRVRDVVLRGLVT